MTLPSDSSYPIARLQKLLSERVGIELSPIDLTEILWLALQQGGGVVAQPPSQALPEASSEEHELAQAQRSPPAPSSEAEASANAPSAAVVAEPPPSEPKGEEKQETPTAETVLPVNIPAAVALRNRREIARSLRPLMRKVPSKLRRSLDEEATAIQSAEAQTWRPVEKPDPERWLELAIVIEVTNLLEVWSDPIAEFRQLMERHGAFRDVRTWQLKPNASGKPELFLQTAVGLKGRARSPKELLDAGGRRLILLLSDCTSTAWRSGKIPQLLQLWSRENPVTIVQLLPEHYWDRSALKSGYLVALRSRLPGALSRDWAIGGHASRRRQRLPEGLKLPVITMRPESLGQWARAIAAIGEQRTTGILLRQQAFQTDDLESKTQTDDLESTTAKPLTAKQLVLRFRGTASAKAQELADRMAVLPVNWSVIRLIQKNLMPQEADSLQETSALHLAEIFLSGLLRPLETTLGQDGKARQQYDFVEGVRDVLLGAIPISEAQKVGEQVATAIFRQLPLEVQQRVSADIERRFGESLSYFEAFLIPDLPWGESAAGEIFPFARVTGQVLRRWGGDYAALAEELEQAVDHLSPSRGRETPAGSTPQLEWFEFEVATVEIAIETIDEIELSATHRTLGLQPFEFEIATIGKQVRPSVEISDSQTALQLIDEAVYKRTGERLHDLQRVIFNQAWAGRTYKEMGVKSGGHSQSKLQNQASDLWRLLSQVTGRQVNKRTLQAAVMQWAATEISEWVTSRQQGQAWQFIEDLGNGVLLEMVQIPSGSFVMGSPEDEAGRSSDEGPQHTVTLNVFFLGKYPVTQAQWRSVAALPQVNRKLNPDPSHFKGNDRPVECITWYDAVEFCDRLFQHTGKQYRLPSEAEWEYACRASPISAIGTLRAGDAVGDGVVSPFHFGETITPDLANYAGSYTYGSGPKGVYRQETTPVGSFGVANAFGLYDMHGNVLEWCADRWHDDYKGAPIDGSAWTTGGERDRYVWRGGSWSVNPQYCRSAYRFWSIAAYGISFIGFRVACSA